MTLSIENIKETLADKKIIGLVIPDIGYNETLIKVVGALSKDYDKILYISISTPCESLADRFRRNKINTNKFYVIDCITRTEKDFVMTKNCIYVSSPKAIDEIQSAILNIIRAHKIDIVVIDSPSSLLTYYEHMDVLQFMHRLMSVLIISNCKGIFPFPRESEGPLRRSVELFTNKVIQLEPDTFDWSVS